VAQHCGDANGEADALRAASVVVDWSHVTKLALRGRAAPARVAEVFPAAARVEPLRAVSADGAVVGRLTDDEYLVLAAADRRRELVSTLSAGGLDWDCALNDLSGACGALALAGPRRAEVIERSAAMDLSPRGLAPGSIVQTTIHFVPCTVLRSPYWDLFIQARHSSESVHAALLDVGQGVGAVAAGLSALPVEWGGFDGE